MLESIYQLSYKARAGVTDAQQSIHDRIHTKLSLPLRGIHGEALYLTGIPALHEKAAVIRQIYDHVPRKNKARDVILLDAWSSATIEGARTTVERVRSCFEHPDSKDAQMVVNTVKGSEYAYRNPITEQNLRKLWKIIVHDVCENSQCMGQQYRDNMVYVGNRVKVIHTPAAPEQITPMIQDAFAFLEDAALDALLRTFVFHFYFVYIHPFCDGNGRLARILNASQLYHQGLQKMPFLPLSSVINEHLGAYYHALEESERPYKDEQETWFDLAPFVSYMLEMFEQCLIRATLAENTLSANEAKLLSRMNKVGRGAEITVKKAAAILSLSDTGTRRVLNKLAQKGYLTIDKGARQFIYKRNQTMPLDLAEEPGPAAP